MYNQVRFSRKKPVKKTHRRYIIYRVIVLLFLAVWIPFSFYTFLMPEFMIQYLLFMPLLMPILVSVIFPVFSLFVFSFRYSIFGEFERSSFPDETPILTESASYGRVGFFKGTIPFFTWTVFPSGLGISILGVGSAFVPMDDIESFEKGFATGVVQHKCEEIRSPLHMPQKVSEALRTLRNK